MKPFREWDTAEKIGLVILIVLAIGLCPFSWVILGG
jgi:hypothetical protein